MSKELTKEQKIEILRESKIGLLKTHNIIKTSNYGICFEIRGSIRKMFGARSIFFDEQIKQFIPEFTLTNARRLAKKYNFQIEHWRNTRTYWWNCTDLESRLNLLDLLIKEINEK